MREAARYITAERRAASMGGPFSLSLSAARLVLAVFSAGPSHFDCCRSLVACIGLGFEFSAPFACVGGLLVYLGPSKQHICASPASSVVPACTLLVAWLLEFSRELLVCFFSQDSMILRNSQCQYDRLALKARTVFILKAQHTYCGGEIALY